MSRRPFLALATVLASWIGVPLSVAVPSGPHAAAKPGCAGIIDLRPSIDRYSAYCTSGTGYVQAFAFCYKIVWIVEDGVAIGTRKSYVYRDGPIEYKGWWEPAQQTTVRCSRKRPFIERVDPLRPGFLAWGS